MTKPQIWVATFLFLFILLFVLQIFTEEKKMQKVPNNISKASPQKIETPEGFITSLGCINCHGKDLKGTNQGPSLKSLKQYWKRDNLINYLRNPIANMTGERFDKYEEIYSNYIMPSFGNVNVKTLGKIADYLLK